MDTDQTAPIEAVCSGPTLFAFMLNSSVMLANYLQQTTSSDDIFRCIFLGALRVNKVPILIDITVYFASKSVMFKGDWLTTRSFHIFQYSK